MSSHANPDIVTDGLAFIYDTGSGKSYKGEPTVNLAGSIVKNFSSWNGLTGSTEYYTTSTGGQGVKLITTASGGVQWYSFSTIYNIQASTQYTISATVKYIGGTPHPNLLYVRQYDANGQTSESGKFTTANERDLGGGWKRIWRTFTTDATTTHINLQGYEYTTGKTIHIQDLQFEQKGHATQFVNGTRSTTQGLLDLTKNETITLSNMSYDSNAQMSLDGTDDQFQISDPGVGTSFSIEVVIKVNSYSNGPIFVSPSSVGIDHFFRVLNNGKFSANFVEVPDTANDGYTSTTVINTGEYYHVVISKTPSNGTIYVNGVAEDSHTPTLAAAAWTGAWRIGARWNNTYNLNGEIPILKVYNKALTASEVLQSYNAIKDRFIR